MHRFRVPGKLSQRLVSAGSTVKAGQLLARLDDTVFKDALTAANAEVSSAKASVELAEKQKKRNSNLLQLRAVSQNAYDETLRQLKSARADLEAAEAKARIAKEQLDYTQLKAAADGVVTDRLVEVGEVVSAGQAILTMVVRAYLPGATIEETALQLTDRIEKKLQETPSLDYIKSYTLAGETTIFVYLLTSTDKKDVPDIWYQVRKKVGDIKAELPSGTIGPFFNDEFGDPYGIIYAFTSDGFSHRELKDYVETVRDELLHSSRCGQGRQDRFPGRKGLYRVFLASACQSRDQPGIHYGCFAGAKHLNAVRCCRYRERKGSSSRPPENSVRMKTLRMSPFTPDRRRCAWSTSPPSPTPIPTRRSRVFVTMDAMPSRWQFP